VPKKVKRLRLFAGPNGSGEKTLFESFRTKYNPGLHINADELQRLLQRQGFIYLNDWGITTTEESYSDFKRKKASRSLLQKARRAGFPTSLDFRDGVIISDSEKPTAYEASYLGFFIKKECLRLGVSFSYESVMSHPSKLMELREASAAGYRTYLYYI